NYHLLCRDGLQSRSRRGRWAPPVRSERLLDLAGFQAACAHVHAARRAAHQDLALLQVGIEASPGGDHRVAAAVSERRTLAAAVTDLGHGWMSLASREVASQRGH